MERPHPKDVGLAFPRTIKDKRPKKGIKPISSKRQAELTQNRKAIKESDLQEYAEQKCLDYGIQFFRIENSVLEWIFLNPQTPIQVRQDASAFLKGFPDLLLMDSKGNYLAMEIKTESTQSKLRQGQKSWLMGKKCVVPRTFEEIDQALKDFANG